MTLIFLFLTIALAKANVELNNVTVKTTARRESAAALYSVQKNASAISDAISAEVIKKSPDRNTSEVLRRVKVHPQDNKFVVIRGLNERYNASLLNNLRFAQHRAGQKAFSFDIILHPSSIISPFINRPHPTCPAILPAER